MLKTLLNQVKQFKTASILTPIFTSLEVVMGVLIPYVTSWIIDRGIMAGDVRKVVFYGVIMLILAFVSLAFGILSGRFSALASTGFAYNLRNAMFRNIQTFSFANIDKFSSAGLVTRMTTDVSNLQSAFQQILRISVRAPLNLIFSVFMCVFINTKMSLIFVVALVILSTALYLIISKTVKLFAQVFERYDDLNNSVQENVQAIRVVKAFVREDFENTKFKKAAENLYHLFVRTESLQAINNPVMTTVIYGCIIALSWFGAHFIVVGDLTTGQLTSLFTYVMTIMSSLMMLSMILADGSIDFKACCFSYGNGEYAIRDITLHINSGETIGIIGGTGCGKSTLGMLVSRLYDASKGSVLVGGVDVKCYDMDVLRNEVAMVLQKNVLFSGTILDNLRWGKTDATLEECMRACQLAQADEFIEQMPDKYNTMIEQNGNNVSGGQKQRLCIARALLKTPKILVLDDSTSACDTATDAKIRRAFREEIPNTTKLIIAQRIQSVQDADRIIVMESGRVNGFDTHENLLKTNKLYQEIYRIQMEGEADFDAPE